MTGFLIRLVGGLCLSLPCLAQTPISSSSLPGELADVFGLSRKIESGLEKQNTRLQNRIQKQAAKYQSQIKRREEKLYRQVLRRDSALALSLFGAADNTYARSKQVLANGHDSLQGAISAACYSPKLDSMRMALQFLQKNCKPAATQLAGLQQAEAQYAKMVGNLQQVDQLWALADQRKTLIRDKLVHLSLGKTWVRYQEQVIYYQQQLEEFKRILHDPQVLERRLLAVLKEIPAFRKFFDRYSVLGTMFRLPGQVEDLAPAELVAGLQTRAMMNNSLVERFGNTSAVSEALNGGIREGKVSLESLKEKLRRAADLNESADLPGFSPNQQRKKTFLQRLQFEPNMQSVRGNRLIPATTDIGLNIGYKLSDRSVVGIGAGTKLNWGKDIRDIHVSFQGIGLRSFLDIKIKGALWIAGAYELNYLQAFHSVHELRSFDAWRPSGLIGLSKINRSNSKLLNKTKFQVLWDFLSYRRLPRAEPFVIRWGYQF